MTAKGRVQNLKEKVFNSSLPLFPTYSMFFCLLLNNSNYRNGLAGTCKWELSLSQMTYTNTLPWPKSSSKILHQVPSDQAQTHSYINLCVVFPGLKKQNLFILLFFVVLYPANLVIRICSTYLQVMKKFFNRFPY